MINGKDININKLKLCYVDGRDRFAWFTGIPLENQWGDDWNDAPYEHNAGEPYETHKLGFSADSERFEHQLVKVAWDGPYETPAEHAGINSSWSVEAINKGSIAWLIPTKWGTTEGADVKPIHAGASLVDFVIALEKAGGYAYLPHNIASQIAYAVRESKLKRMGFEEVSGEERARNLEANLIAIGK
jgi:hypothetical protein